MGPAETAWQTPWPGPVRVMTARGREAGEMKGSGLK